MENFQNGNVLYDTNGDIVHAHGGHILQEGDYYYWYGENRTENRYVSCYRSKDLLTWEFRNHILTTESKTEGIRVRTDLKLTNSEGGKVNLERPKVLFNDKTNKYVLWVHYENGMNYSCAACAIATCDTPDGDFTYHGSMNPFGYMSRDCTLFKDSDGTAYFVSSARGNADTHVYRLADDYMNVDCLVHKLWQGEYREAPAIMERGGRYYCFSSFCTGWAPNQCKYGIADGIESPWSTLTEIGDDTTYHTQPAFILPLENDTRTRYIYVGDRWNAENYYDSRYVFLEIMFDESGNPQLEYCEEFTGK